MIQMNLEQAAKILDAKLLLRDGASANQEFIGVCIDSRTLEQGQLFAALKGEHSDGHDFADMAAAKGAGAALVTREVQGLQAQLLVDDVQLALARLATEWLNSLRRNSTAGSLTVVALTGSNGKTTVKEMLASVLSQQHQVLATSGNFNNELGLPLTIFKLSEEHEYAVLELGANKAGDIQYLGDICNPDIALINNIGPAHLQGFGDLQGVARAKGEIYSSLIAGGTAVINNDEPWMDIWEAQIGASQTKTFGLTPEADISANIDATEFNIHTSGGVISTIKLPLPGQHNRLNALAATAVLEVLEIPPEAIKTGLEQVSPVTGRLNIARSGGGWQVVDDTYNANPASLYAGLAVIADILDAGEEGWLVLGDMAELGPTSVKLHKEMGAAASALGIKRLFAVGDLASSSAEGFGSGGSHYPDQTTLIQAVLSEITAQVTCLVKGSRSMGMETVAAALLENKNSSQHREVG